MAATLKEFSSASGLKRAKRSRLQVHAVPNSLHFLRGRGMWYVARGDQTVGPVSLEQLQAAARDGQLRRDDFVWTEGMEQWAAAFTVANLWPPEIADQPPKIVSPAEAKTAPVVAAAPPSHPEPPAADAPVVAQEVKRPNFLLRH